MESPARDRLLRHGMRSWVILYACWSIPVVLTTLTFYAIQRTDGVTTPAYQTFLRQLYYYFVFASSCPGVYRLIARFPFQQGGWLPALAAQVAGASVVGLAVKGVGAWAETLLGNRESVVAALQAEFTTSRGQFGIFINLTYYLMVLGAMSIIRLHRQRQAQEEQTASLALKTAQLETLVSQARLRALEMQLNPHFLFNSLNSIASLVEQKRTGEAYQAIALLGDLLRETVRDEERHTTTLAEELAFLERYLDLERMRFGDRLSVSTQLAEGCSQALVPTMILQPIVENTVRHAVSEQTGAVQVCLTAKQEGSRLLIRIQDDGPGLAEGWSMSRDAGTGLRNVRDRLAAHFGAECALQVEPATPRGVAVALTLPYQVESP